MNESVELKIDNIKELIFRKYHNNLSWFAEEIGINRSYLSLALKNTDKNKKYTKIILYVILFCIKNNLDFNNYIFFGNNVQKKI